jgi:uncharacterized protein (DUF2225 family)
MAEKAGRITYFSKEALVCPVCSTSFFTEELFTGSGRLIAGELSDELRRMYEPSKKYGEVIPLIYPIPVCPGCYFAAFPKDFTAPDADVIQSLKDDQEKRIASIKLIFQSLDFTESRDLEEGAASYYLAAHCYDFFPQTFSPTIKQAIVSLRAAWLLSDLHRRNPAENYDYLGRLFYRKARFFYMMAVERETDGTEPMTNASSLGPDLDKNYGFDGVLYLTGLMEYKYGPKKDLEKRLKNIENARTIVSRVHGMGKASRSKPSAILEKARDLFGLIGDELETLKESEIG